MLPAEAAGSSHNMALLMKAGLLLTYTTCHERKSSALVALYVPVAAGTEALLAGWVGGWRLLHSLERGACELPAVLPIQPSDQGVLKESAGD